MDVNNIYLVDLFMKVSEKYISDNKSELGYKIVHNCLFIKKTLACKMIVDDDFVYVDLESNETYRVSSKENSELGKLYIDTKSKIIPLSKIIDVKKDNMTKRRILKKFREKNK